MKSFFVYILKCNDNTLYTGWTVDLHKRFQEHNLGRASKYTRARLPVEIVYFEEHVSKSAAMKREIAIKKLSRNQKLALVRSID